MNYCVCSIFILFHYLPMSHRPYRLRLLRWFDTRPSDSCIDQLAGDTLSRTFQSTRKVRTEISSHTVLSTCVLRNWMCGVRTIFERCKADSLTETVLILRRWSIINGSCIHLFISEKTSFCKGLNERLWWHSRGRKTFSIDKFELFHTVIAWWICSRLDRHK